MANAIADSEGFSIAGGGDTLAAIDLFGIADKISYISTGGGAFLEFVEGKVLPAVAMLEERAKQYSVQAGKPACFSARLRAREPSSTVEDTDTGLSNMSKIFDFVKPGVITGDDVQKVFQVAKENNFALPAVNCVGTDSINAVLEAAAKVRSPVIVQFSNGGAAFIAGKGVKTDVPQGAAILGAISGAHHVHQMAEHYGVPVILHTDHCAKKLLPWIDGLLDAGEKHFAATGKPLFSSHMIDLSEESLHENIEICSRYLARMAKMGMTLEIELGCTGGEEDGVDNSHMDASALYTQPEDVDYAYTELSKISPRFTIAASFGNVHGVYKPGNVVLTPTILRDSQEYVSRNTTCRTTA